MPIRLALAILATALSISPAQSQIRGAGTGTARFGISAGSPGMGLPGMGSRGVVGGGSARFHQGHPSERRAIFLPYPYFYSDSDYDSGESSQPQVVVVQASAPAPPPAPSAPRESLLIEWQGDHFVRSTTSAKDSASAQIAPDYA